MPERILVLDDEESIVHICSRVLTMVGYTVRGCTDSSEALSWLEKEPFDLLLIDLAMPRMDGLTVLRQARAIHPGLTAVIMTAYGTLQNAIDALSLGARGFMLKPVQPQDILQTVNQALQAHRREQENHRLRSLLPIMEISQTWATSNDLNWWSQSLIETIAAHLDADLALLWLCDETGEWLRPAAALHADANHIRPLPQDTPWIAQALVATEPLLISSPDDRQAVWQDLVAHTEQVVTVSMTLRAQEKTVGLLCLGRQKNSRPLAASEINLLAVIGRQTAIAIENARLYQAISRAKNEWETTFDAIQDGIAIIDRQGILVRSNQTLAQWLDIPVHTLIGQHYAQVFQLSPDEELHSPHHQAIQTGVAQNAEVNMARLNRILSISAYPLPDDQGQVVGAVCALRDISEQKRAQESLLRSEKLAVLGRLAASLAHEINNPLQALSSGLRLLNRPDLDAEKRQQYIQVAGREVERLIGLVERMLGFYRPSDDRPVPADLGVLLNEILALAAKKLEHSQVVVQCRFDQTLPVLNVIANQIKQVFLNLILNAADAMPNGGTLTISAECHRQTIHIRFSDTGHGIAPEHLPRIFEPFYTTRAHGTGLGLPISQDIIQRHGGQIQVESVYGQGTTFTVVLPALCEVKESLP